MRGKVLAFAFAASVACPSYVRAIPRERPFQGQHLLEREADVIRWNGKMISFKGEKLLAHAIIRGGTLLAITDKKIHWFFKDDATQEVENRENDCLCAVILEEGRSAAIGSRNAVARYEFTRSNGVVTHRIVFGDQATSCKITPWGNSSEQIGKRGERIEFVADDDGRKIYLNVIRGN